MREQPDHLKFHFGDIGLPVKIVVVAILSVLAVIGVGGTVRYAATLPKQPQNQPTQNQNTNQTPAPANTQNSPAITQPQTGTGSSGGGTASRCTTSARNAFAAQYNHQIADENARHQNVVNFLTATNAPASAFAAEDATHASNLAAINSQYQNNLRSIGC